jgi:hypothetical membrane protein
MLLEATPATTPEAWWTSLVFATDQWATIAALLGFGAKHLQNRDGPALRYLTQAVFPCYLAHQTILVAAVWTIRPLNLPAVVEAPLLIAVTVGGCLAVYEGVRRANLLRPLWGLKPLPGRGVQTAPIRAGASSPLIAIGCILLAGAVYPGFNHATRYLSELGDARAPNPLFFDLGLMSVALGGAAAGMGFVMAVPALGGGRIAGWIVGGCFFAAAVGLICGLVFVYPNPWHNLIQLGLGIQIAPFALLWALWRAEGMRWLRWFLIAALAVMLALTIVTKHILWPALVNSDNVGLWERGYAIVLVCWGGVAAVLIERRLLALARSGG